MQFIASAPAIILGFSAVVTGSLADPASGHSDRIGTVMTVNGPVDPGRIGMTLMHEHLFIDYTLPLDRPEAWASAGLTYPNTAELRELWEAEYSPELNSRLRVGWPANRDALVIDDYELVVAELRKYSALGGDTIVEVTPKGMGRRTEYLRQAARDAGINIVAGTAWYQDEWLPDDVVERSVDSLAEELIRDVNVGIGDTGIRAGIIGEIGAESHPPGDLPTDNEIKVLRAAARAARTTGAAVSLHCLLQPGDPLRMLEILRQEGLALDRVIIGHVHAKIARDRAYLRRLARTGAYIEFDLLGYRESTAREAVVDDRTVADSIRELIEWGYGDRILLSHDVYSKGQLTRYGGYGYTFIPQHFLARLREIGVTQKQIDEIMIGNPRRILAFVEPR